MLTYYFSPGACSMAPHIALEEAGAKFEGKAISLANGQHKTPEYLKVSPYGQVPTLLVDGKTLTENVAIMDWVADQHPEANLLPSDPWERIQALSYLFRPTSHRHNSFGPLFQLNATLWATTSREGFLKKLT